MYDFDLYLHLDKYHINGISFGHYFPSLFILTFQSVTFERYEIIYEKWLRELYNMPVLLIYDLSYILIFYDQEAKRESQWLFISNFVWLMFL